MIIIRYFETLLNTSGSKHHVNYGAVFGQLVLPIVIASLLVFSGAKVIERQGTISAVSFVTALMCAVAVLIFQMRIKLKERDRRLGDRDYKAVDQLFSISVWVIVIGLALALTLIMPDLLPFFDYSTAIYSFIVFLLLVHFICVFVVFIGRFVRAYERIAEKR